MTHPRGKSVRFWLQRGLMLRVPYGVHPFNRKWKFKHYQHDRELRLWIAGLREIADGLEARLDTIRAQAEEHCQP